jgi:hypothetical protein
LTVGRKEKWRQANKESRERKKRITKISTQKESKGLGKQRRDRIKREDEGKDLIKKK